VAELQGVVTAYTVALAALLLTGGTLADVAGRRRVLVAGLAVFAAASAGCALSDTSTELIAWRAVQGVGAALVLPGSLAVLSAAYAEPAARARAVGLWAATGATALLAGSARRRLLVEASGLAGRLLGQPPALRRRRPRRRGGAGRSGTGARPAARRAGPGAGRGRPGGGDVRRRARRPRRAAAAGAPGARRRGRRAGAFAGVERRAADPVLPLALLRRRRSPGRRSGAFAASLAVFVLLVFLSLFLQLVQSQDALPPRCGCSPLTVGLVVVAPLAGGGRPTRDARALS
jgi:DHA2 family methylenomycin A resistance protein-like MFS transporter